MQELLFLHILANTCYLFVFLLVASVTGVKWYLMLLICIFLVFSNVEYSFMHLQAIYLCIYSEKMSIWSTAHFY